jgi:hypothetical protein
MKIEFKFDDELEHVLIVTVKNGWLWSDFHAANDAILNYPPNIAIPEGVRVDYIVDFRDAPNLPPDGIGLVNVKKGEAITKFSPYDVPRNGGFSMYVGNPVFVSALLRTFGIKFTSDFTRKTIVTTIEKARESIREHRAITEKSTTE